MLKHDEESDKLKNTMRTAWLWTTLLLFSLACDDGESTDAKDVVSPQDSQIDLKEPDTGPQMDSASIFDTGDAQSEFEVVDVGSCLNDEDCPESHWCDEGLCVEGCRNHQGCALGERCLDHLCQSPEPCEEDEECAPEQYCQEGECFQGCRLDNPCSAGPQGENRGCHPDSHRCEEMPDCCDVEGSCEPRFPEECDLESCGESQPCPGNMICMESGACVESSNCRSNEDCLNTRICINELCQERCTTNSDCPGERICLDGFCPEAEFCQTDLDCDIGRFCLDERCINSCGSGAPCPGSQICGDDGGCHEPELCEDDIDCFEFRRCISGNCQELCFEDSDCPGSRLCVEGLCPEAQICLGEQDCDFGRVCLQNICIGACNPENPCSGAQICREDGLCQEPELCQNSDDCLFDRVCIRNDCIDLCSENSDCPGSRSCQIETGICPEAERCLSDNDCNTGRVCYNETCIDQCNGENPCHGNQTCDESGICREAEECFDDLDCFGTRVCQSSTCSDACANNSDCEGTRECDVISGHCPEPLQCFIAEDCDQNRLCIENICIESCDLDHPCPGTQYCDEGLCQEGENCDVDSDCLGERVCEINICQEPCSQDVDCSPGQSCDDDGHCQEPNHCRRDDVCLTGRICAGGQCVAPQCERHGECIESESCVDRLCMLPIEPTCSEECSAGQICTGQVCLTPGPCSVDQDCPEARPVCSQGVCRSCRVDSDCYQSESCINGRCMPFGECEFDEDCPGLQTCLNNSCSFSEPCINDRFEDNSHPILMDRTYSDLVLCDGEEDRFFLVLEEGEGLEVTLIYDPSEELTLELLAGSTPPIKSSYAVGIEKIGILPSENITREIEINVKGRLGQPVEYSLDIKKIDYCPSDGFEGPTGNDYVLNATPVDLSDHFLRLCEEDQDWLKLNLPIGSHLQIVPEIIGEGQIDITILNEEEEIVAQGEQIETDILAGGIYYVKIVGNQTMELVLRSNIGLSESGREQACDAAPALAVNQSIEFPRRENLTHFDTQCAFNNTSDEIFKIHLDEDSHLSFSSTERDDIDFSFMRDCGGEELCGLLNQEHRLEAGDWYVIANHSQMSGRLELTMDILPAHCDEDEDCPGDSLCNLDGCHPPCEPLSCPGAQICDNQRCQEPINCLDDEDCLGLRVCENLTCIDLGCQTHDECPFLCVNRACEDSIVTFCSQEQPCPVPQVCTPLGACVLDAPCSDSADCPEGLGFCDQGSCVSCIHDSDCTNSESCNYGRCHLVRGCQVDDDCPGERHCLNSECRTGICEFDTLDLLENPTLQTRAYTDLILCDGDIDVYNIEIPGGEGLSITLRHDPYVDLLMEIQSPATLDTIMVSDEFGSVERLIIPPAQEMRNWALVVAGQNGYSIPYSLDLRTISQDSCIPDELEGPHGNNNQQQASFISTGSYNISLCEGDHDWFQARLAPGTRATVEISEPLPNLEVFDEFGELILQESGSFDSLSERAYYIHIYGDAGTYELSFQVNSSENPLEQRCVQAEEIQIGQPLIINPSIGTQVFHPSCGSAEADSFVAMFELFEPSSINIDVNGAHLGAIISVQADCQDSESELICVTAQEGRIENLSLNAGSYFILVQESTQDRLELILSTN